MPNFRKLLRKTPRIADTADRHHYYQLAVQCVEAEIDMVDWIYHQARGRHATKLREDFCGTANTSCEWVRRRDQNTAVGVDNDAAVLDWGRQHNLAALPPDARARIRLLQDDVRDARCDAMDIILAMNFSYQLLKTRDELRAYFTTAYRSLAADGMLMLDNYGGHDSWRSGEEETEYAEEGFTYCWEQRDFNPINFHAVCDIHFKFPDGSQLKRAFSYQWRMWTLPEIRTLLEEVGFRKSTVFWEGTDPESGEGNDEYFPTEQGEDDPSWIVYLSAEK